MIERLKYRRKAPDSLSTQCPHKVGPMVGSYTCLACECFVKCDNKDKTIDCRWPAKENK